MKSDDIRPFIPTADLNVSKSFYEALGFTGDNASDELVLMTNGNCTFFLYKNDNGVIENDHMFQLAVPNIDNALESIEKVKGFNFKFEPIKEEHWGKVIYLWGPFGEMWHVTELGS